MNSKLIAKGFLVCSYTKGTTNKSSPLPTSLSVKNPGRNYVLEKKIQQQEILSLKEEDKECEPCDNQGSGDNNQGEVGLPLANEE